MVEGHALFFLTPIGQELWPVPLHQLRWSPSPKGEEFYFNPRAFSMGSTCGSRPAKLRYITP